MTTALTAAESALAAIMGRADAALAVMRKAAQDAAARLKAARLEVARIKAERLSLEQTVAETAAGFEALAAEVSEVSDAFPAPAPTQTPEEVEYEFLTGEKLTPEPIELTEERVAPEQPAREELTWGQAAAAGLVSEPGEEVTAAANGPATAANGRRKRKPR